MATKNHNPLNREPAELAAAFASLKSRADLAKLLNVKASLLTHVAYRRRPAAYYKSWTIKKKSGGQRTIQAPQGSLYLLQAKINAVLQAAYAPKPPTHGFVRGRSVTTNARPHVESTLIVDLSDKFARCYMRGASTASTPARLE